jgi:hypothetical protein
MATNEEVILQAIAVAKGEEPMPGDIDGQALDQMSLYLTYWVAESVVASATPDESEEESEENYRTAMSQAIVAAYLIGLEDGLNVPRETQGSVLNAEIIDTLIREGSVTITLNIE